MSEQVVLHRGRTRDENGQLTPDTADLLLTVIAIQPGGGSESVQRGRDGESVDCIVYLPIGADISDADELTVRGERFHIVVNKWQWERSHVCGLEVLCTRGQG